MTNYVTFPTSLGGSGDTYSDGGTEAGKKNLAQDGHSANFVPLCGQVVAMAQTAKNKADAAATSETAAAASANSALLAPGTSATSSTSLAIPTSTGGTISFTIQTGKLFSVGQTAVLAVTADPGNKRVSGPITAHNSGTGAVTMRVDKYEGSGTYNAWTFGLEGTQGKDGAAPQQTTATIAAGVLTLDLTQGTYFKVTVDQAITSIALTDLSSVNRFYVELKYTGNYAVTFPTAWLTNPSNDPLTASGLNGTADVLQLVRSSDTTKWTVVSLAETVKVGAAENLWVAELSGVALGDDLAADASGNIYLAAHGAGDTDGLNAYKLSSTGTLGWAKRLDDALGPETSYGVGYDGSGNVYLLGMRNNTLYLSKRDSAGALSWQKSIAGTSLSDIALAVDSSGNSYIGCVDGANNPVLIKVDATGAYGWAKKLGEANSSNWTFKSLALDTSGNVYAIGTAYISKVDPATGALVAQKYFSGTSFSDVVVASDAVYVLDGNAKVLKFPLDLSALDWIKTLTDAGAVTAIHADAGGAWVVSTRNSRAHVLRLDTSGALTLPREVYDNTGGTTTSGYDVLAQSSGALVVRLYLSTGKIAVARLAATGKITGTFGSKWVVAKTYGPAAAAGSLTGYTGTTIAAASYTVATSTLTDSAPSVTVTKTNIW